jgi:hypothetical protein
MDEMMGMKQIAINRLRVIAGMLLMAVAPLVSADSMKTKEDNLKSQLDVISSTEKQSISKTACRVLFIGDSITQHGFNPGTVEKLGWDHIAGMAATTERNDYAHQFCAMLQERLPERKVEIYFHTSGGGGSAAQRLSGIDDIKKRIAPQIVVIQLGEHEQEVDGKETFRSNYANLISSFDEQTPRPLVLCAGVWNPGDRRSKQYSGWPARVEAIMREECLKRGIPFASVEKYAVDPTCSGWGESKGVQWHPNDKGHLGYADALIECFDASKK